MISTACSVLSQLGEHRHIIPGWDLNPRPWQIYSFIFWATNWQNVTQRGKGHFISTRLSRVAATCRHKRVENIFWIENNHWIFVVFVCVFVWVNSYCIFLFNPNVINLKPVYTFGKKRKTKSERLKSASCRELMLNNGKIILQLCPYTCQTLSDANSSI